MKFHLTFAAVVLVVLAGCSNRSSEQLTGPSLSSEFSRVEPGLPPIEQSNPPRIRVWNDDGFRVQQKTGGVSLAPDRIYSVDFPEQEFVTFYWTAIPAGQAVATRWAVDIQDITDETPRFGPGDISHWSAWSATEASATLGMYDASSDTSVIHHLYIEARNKVGLISLVAIRLRVVSATDPVITRAR